MTTYDVFVCNDDGGPVKVASIDFHADFDTLQARQWAEQIRDLFRPLYQLHSIRCSDPAGTLPCQDDAMRIVILNVFREARKARSNESTHLAR